ncbi:MAG: condensation domain-containing protein, partial [Acidobacteria bacterium]|nr:condensation domain-containing protein [Acidobacteriota bacterium]
FDLERGPVVRARLLRLSAEEHVLVFTVHHIASDGWSTGVMIREVASLYEAFSLGQPSPLPELPIQYVDYAVWQRQWLQGDVLKSQLSYWREQLAGAPVLEVPTDRVRPALQSFRGARHYINLGEELSRGLRELSRAEGVTLYMVLLAGFQILLSRYSGQEDVVVGSPIAGRTRAELEPLIGFFVNTLVLRTDLSGEPTVREVLRRVREVSLGGYGHQDVPFEQLVEELGVERDLSRNPLFQVMFALQNATPETFIRSGLNISIVNIERPIAAFDLSLLLKDTTPGMECMLEYSTDLFESETIQRMMTHFQRVLEWMVGNPRQKLSDLSLL